MRMAAPRTGAAIINLLDRRRKPRPSTARRSQNQLVEPLRQLAMLRRALDAWNEAGGSSGMPQPAAFGIRLPDLQPAEILWRGAA